MDDLELSSVTKEVSSKPNPTEAATPEPAEPSTALPEREESAPLDRRAVWSLCGQHVSSSWGQRSFEFASYLYIITLFPNSLLLPSIFGFVTTSFAIAFAGLIGNLVDRSPRLRFVRRCIIAQKVTVCASYACFLILFLRYRGATTTGTDERAVMPLFAFITLLSAILSLATIAISVSIERDWVTTIAQGNSEQLTMLNTYLRRIDLITKLVAPLFVSLLTTAVSYPFSVAFLLGLGLVTMIFEFIWIDVVFRRLPILGIEEETRLAAYKASQSILTSTPPTLSLRLLRTKDSLRQAAGDWKEFFFSPVFPSSLSISLLYLSVLSFDGAMLSYLKSHGFGDAFLAGMRGVCVVTGLLGTVGMPIVEKRIGVVRTGIYSISSEAICLIPVLLSFFISPAPDGQKGSSTNAGLLFTGMALSRIGLWSFDLCQLKQLQTTLQDHPRRNSMREVRGNRSTLASLSRLRPSIVRSFVPSSRCTFCGTALRLDQEGSGIRVPATEIKALPREPVASTSALPYFTSQTPYSTAPPLPASLDWTSPTSLEDLKLAVEAEHRSLSISVFNRLKADELKQLERSTFDALFRLVAQLDRPEGTPIRRPREAFEGLKALRALAKERVWGLSGDEREAMLLIGQRWRIVRDVIRLGQKRIESMEGRGKLTSNEMERRRYVRDLQNEVLGKPAGVGTIVQRERAGSYENDYSPLEFRMRSQRYTSSRPLPESISALPSPHPIVSASDSHTLLSHFNRHHSDRAFVHLHTMLDSGTLPTKADMKTLARSYEIVESDTYAEARKILDGSSKDFGSAELDQLLEKRLAMIDKDSWLATHSTLAFIRWIALDQTKGEASPLQWMALGLRLWETIYTSSSSGEKLGISSSSFRLLAHLISETCSLESERPRVPSQSPSPALSTSISLATAYLPPPLLVAQSSRLLNAICVISPSPVLSRNLYHHLRTRAPPDSIAPFHWTGALIEPFVYLLKTSVVGPLELRDPGFTIQLYLDITSEGLSFPRRSWGLLWKALGTRGSVEETSRVLTDYEQSGRVDSRISGIVLVASATAGKIVTTLRLLDLFHTKLSRPIPLEAYNSILRLLASSYHDRRRDSYNVFKSMITNRVHPSLDTWNAILANHVFRPRLTMEDIDGAGEVYNSLFSASVMPDRITYSLLLHGFLRIAKGSSESRVRRFGLEAALRTFESSMEKNVGVRGFQLADLMGELSKRGRWEEAKFLCERWWSLRLAEEGEGLVEEGEREEEFAVRRAGERLAKAENLEAHQLEGGDLIQESPPNLRADQELSRAEETQTVDIVSPASFPLIGVKKVLTTSLATDTKS